MLENQVKSNQKRHMEMVEKISSLYERLRLDVSEKYKFLSVNQVIAIALSSPGPKQVGIKSQKVKLDCESPNWTKGCQLNLMGHVLN